MFFSHRCWITSVGKYTSPWLKIHPSAIWITVACKNQLTLIKGCTPRKKMWPKGIHDWKKVRLGGLQEKKSTLKIQTMLFHDVDLSLENRIIIYNPLSEGVGILWTPYLDPPPHLAPFQIPVGFPKTAWGHLPYGSTMDGYPSNRTTPDQWRGIDPHSLIFQK